MDKKRNISLNGQTQNTDLEKFNKKSILCNGIEDNVLKNIKGS